MKRSLVVAIVAAVVVAVLPVASALAGFSGSDVFLPMVGRQAGIFPSNWYTTVWIYNPGSTAVTARVYLLVRNTANISPPWVDVPVAAGDTEKLENVVESLFHQQVFGALRVTCETQKLVVTSRVYSKGAGAGEMDSVGQDFAGVPAAFAIGAGEKTQVLGVYQTEPSADSDYRFNFGFVETTGHQANVRVRAFDGNGADQGYKDFNVREWSQRQVAFKDHFPSISTDNVRLEVEVLSGTGKVIAYGSGIANASQDPTTYEMAYSEKLLGIANVQHDETLVGDGTAAALLGLADSAVSKQKLAVTGGGAGQVLGTSGSTLLWQDDGLKLPYSGSAGGAANVFQVTSLGSGAAITGTLGQSTGQLATGYGVVGTHSGGGIGVYGLSASGPGTRGESTSSYGLYGTSASNDAVRGETTGAGAGLQGISVGGPGVSGTSTSSYGVYGSSANLDGVFGEASAAYKSGVYGVNSNPAGYAGFFAGQLGLTGNLDCTGCVHKGALSASGGTGGQVLGFSGSELQWQSDSIALPFSGSAGGGANVFQVTSTGSGPAITGIRGQSSGQLGTGYGVVGTHIGSGIGVYGTSSSGPGVRGTSTSGEGIFGESTSSTGVRGGSTGGYGIYGTSTNNVAIRGESVAGDAVSGGTAAATKAGVYGVNSNASGFGVFGRNSTRNTTGYLGGDFGSSGAYGRYEGFLGYSDGGVLGRDNTSGNWGYLGMASYAAYFSGPVRVSGLGGGGAVYADANGVLTLGASDTRLKQDVVPLSEEINVVSALARLRGVAFNWDTAVDRARNYGVRREIGLIAQEVEAVLPQVVGNAADGYKTLDYAKLTAFLIEVAKAQQARIEVLEKRLAAVAAR